MSAVHVMMARLAGEGVDRMLPPAPDDSDEVLMRRLQAGVEAAYDELFQRWRRPIFTFLQRRAGSHHAAEEAFQETWLRVFRSRHSYDSQRPFRPWLYRIAANAGHDAAQPVASDFHWVDPAVGGEQERIDVLLSAMQSLSPEDRRLLLLVVEGFTSEEAADILGIGAGAVRMRLSRARQRILECLHA